MKIYQLSNKNSKYLFCEFCDGEEQSKIVADIWIK